MQETGIPQSIAIHFNIPKQIAEFFYLLIANEFVSNKMVEKELRSYEARQMAYRLRQFLTTGVPSATVYSRRAIGYWLDESTRYRLADIYGLTLRAPRVRAALTPEMADGIQSVVSDPDRSSLSVVCSGAVPEPGPVACDNVPRVRAG